jgi:hypothetical protein
VPVGSFTETSALQGEVHTQNSQTATVNACASSGYSDITAGAKVTITDGAGKVLALEPLGRGGPAGSHLGTVGAECVFGFTANVPETSFYEIQVSGHDAVRYTLSQMKSKQWRVGLLVSCPDWPQMYGATQCDEVTAH